MFLRLGFKIFFFYYYDSSSLSSKIVNNIVFNLFILIFSFLIEKLFNL